MSQQRLIPNEFAILGASRGSHTDDEFRDLMKAALTEFGADEGLNESEWESFAKRISYLSGDFGDAALYQKLKTKLEELDAAHDTGGNHIFYLASAPEFGIRGREMLARYEGVSS